MWHEHISVQFSLTVLSNSYRPHRIQHIRLPCPSPTPGACSNSCPWSWWCHTTMSSAVIPFSSLLNLSQHQGLFQWISSSIRWPKYWSFSFSISPSNEYSGLDWLPLGRTGWISLQCKGLSRVFSSTTVEKHQFFSTLLSLQSNSHIHTWPLEKP